MQNDLNIPTHIAIILDGNGRWAKKRGMPRVYGHRKGAYNISNIAQYADEIGIKVMSIYCFSTENWSRPGDEVTYLMKLPIRYFSRYKEKIKNSNIKVIFSGRRDHVSEKLNTLMDEIVELTKDHVGLILNICFDYGSRDELVRAIKNIANDIISNKITISDIDTKLINSYLDTKNLPDVDLLIRTSGEQRISNFLLWQIAYAELYFTDILFPDFNEAELEKALDSYSKRDRRYGGINYEKKSN